MQDQQNIQKLVAYGMSHDCADVRLVGDKLRVAMHATQFEGQERRAVTAIEFIEPTFSALRAVLGY